MSKPDWRLAPKWAKYLAMDSDGCWRWYSHKPHAERWSWSLPNITGRFQTTAYSQGWEQTLERRH